MYKKKILGAACAAALVFSTGTYAKVSAEEAAKLGGELTPTGATKAGNADGSIPEWTPWGQTGELGSQFFTAENFPETIGVIEKDKPLFEITKANYKKHADKLSEGHKALFELYPTYKMKVYPSKRIVGYPEKVYEFTKKNAGTATLEGCNDCLRNSEFGFPFPIPKNGVEAMWNPRLRWREEYVKRYNNQAIVQQSGSVQLTKLIENVKFPYTLRSDKERVAIDDKDDIMIYYQSETLAPPRNAGQYLLAWEHVGYRSAWLYNPGLRRVRRAPNVAYDNPYEGTDGQQFYDQVDMYNGAMDRYDFKLVGKKELYIPYNNYEINKPTYEYEDILGKEHINQDLVRYELHRVWVVDSTLRDGTSHQFKRRTFYIDEDSWAIAAIDCYDNRDKLWKFQEGELVYANNAQAVGGVPEVIYDLQSGLYFATAMFNEDQSNDYSVSYEDRYFSPQSLKRRTSR